MYESIHKERKRGRLHVGQYRGAKSKRACPSGERGEEPGRFYPRGPRLRPASRLGKHGELTPDTARKRAALLKPDEY